MTTKDKFRYPAYDCFYTCQFVTGRYGNGNLALEMMGAEGTPEYGEPICRVTVNPGMVIPEDCIAVKDYGENEGMVDFIVGLDIVEAEPVSFIPSGYVTIPVLRLTESGKELFNNNNQ